MAAFMFMWRSCDHTMKEAIECSGLDYKGDNLIEAGFADVLDMIEAAETAANCLGREDDLGIGITYKNYFLEITESVKKKFHEIEFLCPTELFDHKENFSMLRPHIYDRDQAMTISLVCWNPELYSDLETAIDENGITRANNPINGSSSVAVYDMIDALITGASVHSASGVSVAIENDEWYIDLTLADGMDVIALNEFDAIEHAFEMDEFAPYLKEIE